MYICRNRNHHLYLFESHNRQNSICFPWATTFAYGSRSSNSRSRLKPTALISLLKNTLTSRKIDGIILQDYNKGVLAPELISWLLEEANKLNIPTYIDPKKDNFFTYKNATLVKPNLKESFEALSMPIVNDDKTLTEIAEVLKSKLNADYIVITRSEKGILALENERVHYIRNQPRSIADVCGAGDTVIATLSMCLSNGLDLKSSRRSYYWR